MSQDPTTLPISVLEQVQIGTYLIQAESALFMFDWIITLDQEINVVWKRRCSLGTVLFVLTRYSTLAYSSQAIWGIYSVITNTKSCKAVTIVIQALTLTQHLCYAIFTTLRAYSLLEGTNIKLVLSGIICALSLMPFAANTSLYSRSTIEYTAETSSCDSTIGASAFVVLRLSLAVRISASLADILVLLITWYKTATVYRTSRKHGITSPLTTLLIRDGTFYFLILLLINILTVLVDNIPSLFNLQLANVLQAVITPMLICQFMLNLRNITSNKSTSEQERTWSSVHFVGNMGQTLRAPGEEEDDGWDHELPQDQEEQQEDSNGVSLPSDIESGARDHEGVGEETMSRSQSGGGVVDEGA